MGKINYDTWVNAQVCERRAHTLPFEVGYEVYKDSYRQYFEHLGISPDLQGKTIIEIGPADYPALEFCRDYAHSYIIEPMPGSHLFTLTKNKPLSVIIERAEEVNFPPSDEVWLFNVLQHTQYPAKIISKAKKTTKLIRFFEPINFPTDKMHLHIFTLAWFKKHFGSCVKHYPKTNKVTNFHTWECAYGIYKV